ncbi:DUF3883 domain-containing protein [Chryseobacterium sp. FH2]|uniref:DUF3883 domain-containing protein n=1 Tax=Chryseobacterium sp. FH2 TaxID=1674291 RepID=UPI00065AC7C7|nr:DUF3883 domain-containing protein [Chryseobacterium sp. FH2]
MQTESCSHGSIISTAILAGLHHNQGGTGRHRCPNCAYQLGFNIGILGKYGNYAEFLHTVDSHIESCPSGVGVPTEYLEATGGNQGGTGRHKCCNCAFKKGFEAAIGIIKQINAVRNSDETRLLEVDKPESIQRPSLSTNAGAGSIVKNFDFEGNYNLQKLIGDIGEEIVLKHEKSHSYNQDKLDRIKNIAKEVGDGMGYDIHSFDADGNVKYIEVKTTTADFDTAFYISINEKNFLFNNENTFIYRLFNLSVENKAAEFYILNKQDILNLNYLPQIFKINI